MIVLTATRVLYQWTNKLLLVMDTKCLMKAIQPVSEIIIQTASKAILSPFISDPSTNHLCVHHEGEIYKATSIIIYFHK